MAYRKLESFFPKEFKPGQLLRGLKAGSRILSPEIETFSFSLTYENKSVGSHPKEVSEDDLKAICGFSNDLSGVRVNLQGPDKNLSISIFAGQLNVHVHSKDAALLSDVYEIITRELELKPYVAPTPKVSNRIDTLEKRVTQLESKIRANPQRLKCFLSYRFNKHAEAYINQLTRFLELLDIDVISGASYEPRHVTDKVKARLAENIDFIVYLVTSDGETAWTRDELITAFGSNAYLIPIVENGAKFDNGILGDIEYIPFEANHIGDAFARLLEAIRFMTNT